MTLSKTTLNSRHSFIKGSGGFNHVQTLADRTKPWPSFQL